MNDERQNEREGRQEGTKSNIDSELREKLGRERDVLEQVKRHLGEKK